MPTQPRFIPSEEGLKMALAAAHAGIWEWYLDNNESAWSEEIWPLYGLSPVHDKPCIESWLKSVHPEDRDRASQIVTQAAQNHTHFEAEWRTNPELGPIRWLLCRGQPAQKSSDSRASFTGIVMDITTRKNAEHEVRCLNEFLELRVAERTAALSEHERLLQNILDGMPGLVGYWNQDLLNRFANKTYMEWFGKDPTDIRGHHIRDVIGEKLFQEDLPYMEAALRGESGRFERTIPILGHPGKHRIVQAHYLPDVVDGVTRGFLVNVFDISQIKQAEFAAEAANKAKSEFLANISHEVRTPLNAMFGLAQVGARNAAATPAARTFSQILDSAQHLLTLVDDLLDFSKIEAGKLQLHCERIDLGQVLDHVMALKTMSAQAKGLTLEIVEAPEVPQHCHGDATRLSQILLNLLSNAIKFTTKGTVRICLDYKAPDLTITVTDTGLGMTAQKLAQLFKPFVQVHDSHHSQLGGTGLGLAITKRLVAMMQGHIKVASTPGQGSTFTVTLPLIEPEAGNCTPLRQTYLIGLQPNQAATVGTALRSKQCTVVTTDTLPEVQAPGQVLVLGAALLPQLPSDLLARHIAAGHQIVVSSPSGPAMDLPANVQSDLIVITGPLCVTRLLCALKTKPSRQTAATTNRLQGLRILAAEDNPVNRLVLQQMLEQEGASVIFAFDGEHALEQARIHGPSSFDIMLCDIQMPVLDGYQTAQALRHIAPSLPIIGLTAHAFDTAKQQAKRVGMVGYVTKPYLLDTLVDEIRRHARRRTSKAPTPTAAMQTSPGDASSAEVPTQDTTDWCAMQQYFREQPLLLGRLIDMLGATLSGIQQELDQAVGTRNLSELAKVAHNIKGTALNLHTPELARLAGQAQEQAVQLTADALHTAEILSTKLKALVAQARQHQSREAAANSKQHTRTNQ